MSGIVALALMKGGLAEGLALSAVAAFTLATGRDVTAALVGVAVVCGIALAAGVGVGKGIAHPTLQGLGAISSKKSVRSL